jgi:hypothetical protein
MNASAPSDRVYAQRWLILGILSVSVFLVVVDNLIQRNDYWSSVDR